MKPKKSRQKEIRGNFKFFFKIYCCKKNFDDNDDNGDGDDDDDYGLYLL